MLGNKVAGAPRFKEGYQLPEFLRDDAFALRVAEGAGDITRGQSDANLKADRKVYRLKIAVMACIAVALTLVSMCFSLTGSGSGYVSFYNPIDVASNLWNWSLWQLSNIFGLGLFDEKTSLVDVAPLYAQVVQRAGITLATVASGALLACAGMLYQVVFRNPIASPSLLGVTHGVQVGLLFVFATYGAISFDMHSQRFVYGYTAGIVTLAAVFVLSKLITKRKTSISVFDMLVVGTIMSAFLGAVVKYMMDQLSALNIWIEFFEYQEALDIYYQPITYVVLIGSVLVAFVPVAIMRYRLNLLSFSDGEIRVMGGHPAALRVLSIIAGSIMILTAQVFVGSASSFALVVPFLARYLFGSEFRRQLWGNVLLGTIVLLICRDLTVLIPFPGIGLPIGVVAGAVTLPLFVWATTFSRKGW